MSHLGFSKLADLTSDHKLISYIVTRLDRCNWPALYNNILNNQVYLAKTLKVTDNS